MCVMQKGEVVLVGSLKSLEHLVHYSKGSLFNEDMPATEHGDGPYPGREMSDIIFTNAYGVRIPVNFFGTFDAYAKVAGVTPDRVFSSPDTAAEDVRSNNVCHPATRENFWHRRQQLSGPRRHR